MMRMRSTSTTSTTHPDGKDDFLTVDMPDNDDGHVSYVKSRIDPTDDDGVGDGDASSGRPRAPQTALSSSSPSLFPPPLTDIENSQCDDRDHGIDNAQRRSLLKTLWSEATSTTDVPQLHHRRTTAAAAGRNAGSGSGNNDDGIYNNNSTNGTNGNKIANGRRRGKQHLPSSRSVKIAKRVWLSFFAALAASVVLALLIHLFRWFQFHLAPSSSSTSSSSLLGLTPLDYETALLTRRIGPEDLPSPSQAPPMTLSEARSHPLRPLSARAVDTAQYTIRINTWHRNEQLLLSLNHHARCDGVAQIQVVWCDAAADPPDEIAHHASGKVVVERHAVNSLNERFKVLLDPPTLGVLSLDDDVLRPCEALDAAFARWTRHPDRMVGFDVRTHVVVDEAGHAADATAGDGADSKFETDSNSNSNVKPDSLSNSNFKFKSKSTWKYGYLSTTERTNRYSLTLPRASFLHRDYLDLYVLSLPRDIYVYVALHLECEDIAMSFLVSSLTDGKPPLIADYWAVKSMVKLYSEEKISGGKDHKQRRDVCVDRFAEILGLKEDGEFPLRTGKVKHSSKRNGGGFFGYGDEVEEWSAVDAEGMESSRLRDLVLRLQDMSSGTKRKEELMEWLAGLKGKVMEEAKRKGMIEKTEEWRKRWEGKR